MELLGRPGYRVLNSEVIGKDLARRNHQAFGETTDADFEARIVCQQPGAVSGDTAAGDVGGSAQVGLELRYQMGGRGRLRRSLGGQPIG